MGKKNVLGVSMALATLITSTISTAAPAWAGNASGNASSNAKKDDKKKVVEELSKMDTKEKRDILIKLGFIDDTINALPKEEINSYCEKYLSGIEVAVDTTCYLLNEEKTMIDNFSASEEEFIAAATSDATTENMQECIELAKEEYSKAQEMCNDMLELSVEDITKQYGFDEEHAKKAKSIANSVKSDNEEASKQSTVIDSEEASKQSTVIDSEEASKQSAVIDSGEASKKDINDSIKLDSKEKHKGKRVHGCSNSANVSTTLSIFNDSKYNQKGKKFSLVYSIESNYSHTYSYKDVSAIAWDGKLEVDGVEFYSTYKKTGCGSYCENEDVINASENVIFESDGSNETYGIVEPKKTSVSSPEGVLEDMVSSKMVCWTGKQIYHKNYKLAASIEYAISSGYNTVYVHPNVETKATSCKVMGEYIHKTSSFFQFYGDGEIGEGKYKEYFPDTSLSKEANLIKTGVDILIGYIPYVGTFYTYEQAFVSNFCSTDNIQGPVCAVTRTCSYK